MDTKSRIIEIATALFQQKGYMGVGLNEILKACHISKGALYHHFPNGKEELLIACLQALNEAITEDIEEVFKRHANTQEATVAVIDKLIGHLEAEGTVAGYTFSSIVSEMAAVNEPVREACNQLYQRIQNIYVHKLAADGFAEPTAKSVALTMTAAIEGGMLFCLTQKSTEPLRVIAQTLPNLLKGLLSSE